MAAALKRRSGLNLGGVLPSARRFSAIEINPFSFLILQFPHAALVVYESPAKLTVIRFYSGVIFRKNLDDRNCASFFFGHAGLPENDIFSRGQSKLDWQKI